MQTKRRIILFTLVLLQLHVIQPQQTTEEPTVIKARPEYYHAIPNGDFPEAPYNKSTWAGNNVLPENCFDQAMTKKNFIWSKVCKLDSDGDGFSNGYELGDPLCKWKTSSGVNPYRAISHPGVCEPLESKRCTIVNTLTCEIIESNKFRLPYKDKIPNGRYPEDPYTSATWPGNDTAPETCFDRDMHKYNYNWTAVCPLDSDHDDRSNGYELGDPECVWNETIKLHKYRALSHPGICDQKSKRQCALIGDMPCNKEETLTEDAKMKYVIIGVFAGLLIIVLIIILIMVCYKKM